MCYRLLFFDLDETIYPASNGLWDAIAERMTSYMVERLNIPVESVHEIRMGYFETYGTTLRGLQNHYSVDALDFLKYVHDIPLDQYLLPDPHLRPLLCSLPQRKWIFTNADAGHAGRVLDFFHARDCFEGIMDVVQADFLPKPSQAYYERALALAGIEHASDCVLLDDMPRNLAPARAMGFTTVLVRPGMHADPAADLVIPNLHALPQAFPQLWEN